MKGRKQKEGFIKRIKEINTGRVRSAETRAKMSKAKKGTIMPESHYLWRYKKIDQFLLDGTLLKCWSNIRDASKYYKVGTSEISITCKAHRGDYPMGHKSYNRKTCRGFIWKYNEN